MGRRGWRCLLRRCGNVRPVAVSPMAISETKCSHCGKPVSPEIAAANNGLCLRCAKLPESLRREKREFEERLSSGAIFVPTHEELEVANRRESLKTPAVSWELEPEFYASCIGRSVSSILHEAAGQETGNVFLVSTGARLNIAFTENLGVCEYQNEKPKDHLYAFTSENLNYQVAPEDHVEQACPCCGVGLLWYPSRFHMPRKRAFDVFSELATGMHANPTVQAVWVNFGDISYTLKGRG